jgi:hypothetical protein
MQIIKVLSGVVSFLLAGLSFLMVGLIGVAWLSQYSANAGKMPLTTNSIMISQWTLSGWQIYAVVSLLVLLTVAFTLGGVYAFRSPKTTDRVWRIAACRKSGIIS